MARLSALLFLLAACLPAQTQFFPLKDVKPGLRGIGRTVFSGDRVEDFQVEVLGVLENVGPKQSLILARLSGGPLGRTGVMQGMSGSPVYIDGKLVGAVAMAFQFATEPIAGIRPIEDMMRVQPEAAGKTRRQGVSLADNDLTRVLPKSEEVLAGGNRMVDVATPMSFGGFTRATIDQFAPQLRAFGLEPRQGISAGGNVGTKIGPASALKPGSMISVQLMSGDMSVGADGTVTHIDGNRVYAFGHRFLAVGATALPFARAEVVTLLPTISSSFKISTAKELMGTIMQDSSTAVYGELGRRTPLVPVAIRVLRGGKMLDTYSMRMVGDRLLSPLLVQMAVFSSIDATERTTGASSIRVSGEIELAGATNPIKMNNLYAADNGSALLASLSTAVPLAFVLQGGFEKLGLRKVTLDVESFPEKKQLQIDQVTASRNQVRPGEKVDLYVTLAGENGVELSRKVEYTVPVGAPAGPLYFTVADAATTNLTDFKQILGTTPRSPDQIVSIVNGLHSNTSAYVRVWRTDPAYQIETSDLPDPPPSLALILNRAQAGSAAISQSRNSKVGEMEIDAGDMSISGSKTVQVEVKE